MLKKFCFFILSLLLSACAVGPNFHTPKSPKTQIYNSSQAPAKYFDTRKSIPAKWWTVFHSPPINQLIQIGLNHNPSLESAQAALRQTQENANTEIGSTLFPAINMGLSTSRQRSFIPSNLSNKSNNLYSLYSASLNISYNLDFFGGARRELESLLAQVDYQRFQYEAAYLTLSSNIVTTSISEAALREQIHTTQTLIKLQENTLKLVKKQAELGSESQETVLVQETQLAQTRALLPPLEKNSAQLRNSLAVLTGHLPSEAASLPRINLRDLHLPAQLPLSLPSNLVRQRPDVRAAEALLQSASAQIGVATAALFPQFTLTGNYGSTATLSNALFKANSNVWGLGAQVLQPVFNGGALRAKRRAAIAAYDQAVAQYKLTVLQALQNTGDVLHAIEFDNQTLDAQIKIENTRKNTWELTQKQYKLGAVSYLVLLDAERQYQQASIYRIQARAARYIDAAALFQALGGGWWNREKLK